MLGHGQLMMSVMTSHRPKNCAPNLLLKKISINLKYNSKKLANKMENFLINKTPKNKRLNKQRKKNDTLQS
jgi:hypothetical protein